MGRMTSEEISSRSLTNFELYWAMFQCEFPDVVESCSEVMGEEGFKEIMKHGFGAGSQSRLEIANEELKRMKDD